MNLLVKESFYARPSFTAQLPPTAPVGGRQGLPGVSPYIRFCFLEFLSTVVVVYRCLCQFTLRGIVERRTPFVWLCSFPNASKYSILCVVKGGKKCNNYGNSNNISSFAGPCPTLEPSQEITTITAGPLNSGPFPSVNPDNYYSIISLSFNIATEKSPSQTHFGTVRPLTADE